MTRVLHVIHSAKLGGVEVAASRLRSGLGAVAPEIDYRIMTLTRDASDAVEAVRPDLVGSGLNSPMSALRVLRVIRAFRPSIVVTSLWRSVLVGIVAKALVPNFVWVVWVHNSRYTNVLDRLAHALAFRRADHVFVDSQAARDALVPPFRRAETTIVAPHANSLASAGEPTEMPASRDPYSLVYWGRLAAQKRLDHAVRLLAELEEFRLDLYGPDDGEWENVRSLARKLGVDKRLTWHGPVPPDLVPTVAQGSTFFVQLSDFEGLGISVTEAMGRGLIPVVTPVGEVGNYTTDGKSAIHVRPDDLMDAASRVRRLAKDPDALAAMSKCAVGVEFPNFVATFAREVQEMPT